MKVTYWRKIGTAEIYKYYGDAHPYNAENYRQVSEYEYLRSIHAM